MDEIDIVRMGSLEHGMSSMLLLGLISRPTQGVIGNFILLLLCGGCGEGEENPKDISNEWRGIQRRNP